MPRLTLLLLQAAILATPLAAQSQEWNDDDGERRYDRAPRVYWDGQCQVTQRINRDGELVERRRCRGDEAAHARAARADDDERYAPRYRDEDRPRRRAGRYAHDNDTRPYIADERQVRRVDDIPPAPVYDSGEPAVVAVPRVVARPAPLPARIIAQAVPVAKVTSSPEKARPVRAPAAAPVVVRPARVVVAPPVRASVRVAAAAAPAKKPVTRMNAPAPRALAKAPLPPKQARSVVQPAAPKVLARVKAAPQPKLAVRTTVVPVRLAAKPVQLMKPPRVIARIDPAPVREKGARLPARAVLKASPQPAPRLMAKAAGVPARAGKVAVSKEPVRVAVVKTEPVVAARVAAPKPAVAIVKAPVQPAAPRIATAPALPERVAARPAPAPIIKASASGQKSEALVLLPPEDPKPKAEAGAAVRVAADLEMSEPIVQSRVYAKGESYLRSTAYRDYVMRKSSDPYSNLK